MGPIRQELLDGDEGLPGFGGAANLAIQNHAYRDPPAERLVDIPPAHADHALAGAERHKPLRREAAEADEEPAGPGSLGFQLAMECMEVAVSNCRLRPLGFEQVGLVAELEAPVNLLPGIPEGLPCFEPGGVEAASQECLERIDLMVKRTSCVRWEKPGVPGSRGAEGVSRSGRHPLRRPTEYPCAANRELELVPVVGTQHSSWRVGQRDHEGSHIDRAIHSFKTAVQQIFHG